MKTLIRLRSLEITKGPNCLHAESEDFIRLYGGTGWPELCAVHTHRFVVRFAEPRLLYFPVVDYNEAILSWPPVGLLNS